MVERHVSSVVSRNKLKTPAIKIQSVRDPLVWEMIEKYQKAGIKLFISDFSLDTGIPSVGVLAYDPTTFPDKSEIVWTAGTTPDPQKALSRALTEVAQLAGDFNTNSNYVASGLPKFNSLEEARFALRPSKEIDITLLPNISNDNIKVEVENCISALSRIGMDVIVINTVHPKLEIPAFYTIIPGAHFRERATNTSVGMFSAKLTAESGDPGSAVSKLKMMDSLMPGKYYVQFFLGTSHLSLDEPSKALHCLEKALELRPHEEDIPSIYSYMGLCLKELAQYRESIAALEKGEQYDEKRTDIYNLMGFCYYKLKEHEKAIQCFRKVLALNPSSAIDYANIASNYREMGEKENAIRYYRFALELDPSIDFARQSLATLEN